jgi:hypothetical protein
VGTLDWDLLLGDTIDVDTMNKKFTNKYFEFLNEHMIPCKIVQIRQNDEPWFNMELRREMMKRDRPVALSNKGGRTEAVQIPFISRFIKDQYAFASFFKKESTISSAEEMNCSHTYFTILFTLFRCALYLFT